VYPIRTIQILILLACGAGTLAWAQVSGGVFRGEVRDATGALVPKAEIRIVSKESGRQTLSISNGEGLFVSTDAVPGVYELTASRDGFRSETLGPVTLPVNQTVRVDFRLEVGSVTDSVLVEASATQMLESESAEISQVVDRRTVDDMPLNGRSWQQLITLSAGVNPGSPGETGSPNSVNIQGQRSKANLYLADGVSATSSMEGRGNGFDIPLEAVQEFSVQAGAYSAEFSNSAGGVINLQTKSGSDQWHGSTFEYFRNDALDAANFFSNSTGQPKNPLRYNQFGGAVGGPIRRNRTFLFADYQGTTTTAAGPQVTTVRPNAQRQGNFSSVPVPIYNPFAASFLRTPFPGNIIPPTLLDPAAIKISSLLPQPNQFDATGAPLAFNNYAVTRAARSNFEAFDLRLDHQFSLRHSIFIRHSFQNTQATVPSLFGVPLGGTPAGAGSTSSDGQYTAFGYTFQISANLISEFHAGLNRQTLSLRQEDYGQDLSTQFGIPGVNRNQDTSGLSTILVSGVFNAGDSILTPLRLNVTEGLWSEKLEWIRGRHTLRFGGERQSEMSSSGYEVFGRGYYVFLNLSTSTLIGPPGGDAFASFLTGSPFEILRDDFPPGLAGLRSARTGLFLQDDFKITPRLTMTFGARYDVMPYAEEKYNRLANFDPATGTMLIAGQTTSRRLRDTDYLDLAPRAGLAYALTGSTVIRAGYGMGYIDPVGAAGVLNSMQFNTPFYFRQDITEFPFLAPSYTLSSRLPSLTVPSPESPTGDLRYLVPGDRNQYSQTWSFDIQHAWGTSMLLDAGYVGTSGSRLLMTTNINAAPPGVTDPTTRRPYGGAIGEVRAFSNSAHSSYNGAQVRFERRMTHGVYFLTSYTWSKSIDNQSTGTDDSTAGGQSPQNPLNASLDRAVSNFDRTHRLTGSFAWTLPFGRRSILLRDWQISGIFELQTGPPFSVLMQCADIDADGNNCRPNLVRPSAMPAAGQSIGQWFDSTAFAIPSPAAYGDAGRNLLRAPGLANLDASVSKSIAWGADARRRLRIRGDFFNALNHANFGIPVNSVDSPAIGSITTAASGRTIQLSARMEF
jgi:hypothetical protein